MALAKRLQIGLTRRQVAFNQDIKAILPAADVQARYLFYALWGNHDALHHLVDEASHGTKRLRTEVLEDFRIRIPPLEEQELISSVLGMLDDKIDSNHRLATLLENVAVATFRANFIDFIEHQNFTKCDIGQIPPKWTVVSIGDVAERTIGGVWGQSEPTPKAPIPVRCLRGIDVHHLACGKIPDVPIRYISEKQLASRQLETGDILIEASGSYCGRSGLVVPSWQNLYSEKLVYSNFCKRLRPSLDFGRAIIVWMHIKNSYETGATAMFRTGSAFPNLDVDGLEQAIRFALPPEDAVSEFENLFTLAYENTLRQESVALAQLRDSFLPKFISGEIRVRDALGTPENENP
jgi:type I restriction enzyme S subunit